MSENLARWLQCISCRAAKIGIDGKPFISKYQQKPAIKHVKARTYCCTLIANWNLWSSNSATCLKAKCGIEAAQMQRSTKAQGVCAYATVL